MLNSIHAHMVDGEYWAINKFIGIIVKLNSYRVGLIVHEYFDMIRNSINLIGCHNGIYLYWDCVSFISIEAMEIT